MRSIRFVSLFVIVMALVASAQESDRQLTSAAAAERAIEALGLKEAAGWDRKSTNTTIEMVTLVDSTTPFLDLNGREAYRVILDDVPLDIDTATDGELIAQYERDFDVYVDPSDGAVLKIESTLPSYYDKVRSGEFKRPLRQDAEQQLIRNEKYVRVADGVPTPAFLSALAHVPGHQLADRITGSFIVHEQRGFGTRSLWVIETFGTTVWWDGDSYARTLVDSTGLLSSSNRPMNRE